MKQSSLTGLMIGGAPLVIMDAKRRASRGKSPVMPYAGEFNPRKALLKANEAMERMAGIPKLNSPINWLEHMRKPDQRSDVTHYIYDGLKQANVTLADIGTSEEELNGLVHTAKLTKKR